MSKKISLSRSDVMNSKVAKIERTLYKFNFNKHRSYLKLCKQNSELNFQNKNLQVYDSSNKMGKSMLCDSNKIFYLYNVKLKKIFFFV